MKLIPSRRLARIWRLLAILPVLQGSWAWCGPRPGPPENASQKTLYVHRIGSPREFEQLAGVWPDQSSQMLPRVLFTIDRNDRDRVYYINSKVYQFHMDFLNDHYLTTKRGESFYQGALDVSRRRFHIGFLVHRPDQDLYSLEFWEDDAITFESLSSVYRAVRDTFFSVPYFKPNSIHQAGIEPSEVSCLRYLPSRQDYQPLNPGRAFGRLRAVDSEKEAANVRSEEILIFRLVPNVLPLVSGIIMGVPTTPLSHLSILSRSLGIPGAVILQAHERYGELEGKPVYYEVKPDGYELRLASEEELQRFQDAHGRQRRKIRLPADLEYRQLTDLRNQRGGDVIRFGAKSANLGEIIDASIDGMWVPPGFTIPFYYYAEFIRENGLAADVRNLLDDSRMDQESTYRRKRLAELRARIQAGRMNPKLLSLVLEKLHREYAGVGMFVRSTTNAEDLPNFTGAGLYTTVPNMKADKAVVEAIKTVWASVWNNRAYEARLRFGIDHGTVLPAVLIQEGINADNAGVLLTVNPLDPGDKGAINIAAKKGLGIRVVEGHQVPEQVLYYPEEDRLVLLNRSQDNIKLVFAEKGGVRPVTIQPGESVLARNMVRRLARVALRIQEVFGGTPQDIEWLTKDGDVVIVQSRPYPVSTDERFHGLPNAP